MIAIRLLGETVHVAPLTPGFVSQGGIVRPEAYQDDRTQYRVLGVSAKAATKYPDIRPGQNCLVPHLSDSKMLSDGTVLINANQLWAVWDNEN